MGILIAIKSCEAHWNRCAAIRGTWAGDNPFVYFFTGWNLNVPDHYEALPQKTKAICNWATNPSRWHTLNSPIFEHAFLCDTDTYCSIPRLLASGFEQHDYTGYRLEGKDYASGGAGYWLSKKAMKIIAEADITGFTEEDRMVGTILAAAGIALHHDPRYAIFDSVLPTNSVISEHLSSRGPYEIQQMYDAHKRANP